MTTRPTIFDLYKSVAATALKNALKDESSPIKGEYIDKFCRHATSLLWADIYNGIASLELYGDDDSFIFNLGGYIDAYHDIDNLRWGGFTDRQLEGLSNAYPEVTKAFRNFSVDIIEMYLRSIRDCDIRRITERRSNDDEHETPHSRFRNLEQIAWLCQDGILTAEEVYKIFIERVNCLMYDNE